MIEAPGRSYGEDSLDVTKTCMLENFDFMASNYSAMLQRHDAKDLGNAFQGKVTAGFSAGQAVAGVGPGHARLLAV
jgi:hypothetical protein